MSALDDTAFTKAAAGMSPEILADRLIAALRREDALCEALEDLLARFAPDDSGLSEAEIAAVARARAAIAKSKAAGDR